MERSVSNLKLTSIYVKYITVTLACIDIIHTTFSYFNIDAFCLSILSGMSILTFILLYLLSYAFKFCAYHRIPLHYMVVSHVISCVDYYIGIPISDKALYCLYLVLFGIFTICYVANYKKTTRRNN